MKTASSESTLNYLSKGRYAIKLLKMRLNANTGPIIPWSDIEEYEFYLQKYLPAGRQKLTDHSVLEIGYGARPWRLLSMASLGVDIRGIDLERPTYGFNFKRLAQTYKFNGLERFMKSLIRGFFFDKKDLRSLRKELLVLNKKLSIENDRMIIGDASEISFFKPASFSFAFSEDVLEHIPAQALPKVLDNVKLWLKKGSILIFRPNIFTGIAGGHDLDCYPHKIINGEISEKRLWSHLLDPNFKVNTYLNKLRMRDYIQLFDDRFEILEIKHKYDRLGERYLTDELLLKLSIEYTKDELLTNQVAFILRVP